jgi:hypothetical protein
MRLRLAGFAIALCLTLAATQAPSVQIRHDAAARQFVVTIQGKPFTTYCYGDDFKDKPVFYPVMSPNGARVNREFPMVASVPGESTDHPHHQSLFFTYDEVNGIHFWNPDTSGRRIVAKDTKADGNMLVASLAWNDKDGKTVLDETKRVTFGGASDVFWMDHDITLKAVVPVSFGDTKEGAFGIRLNDTLKEQGGTGRYVNAEGAETSANVWGKTSPWVAIRGSVKGAGGDKDVTVAIFAHPSGLNAPPYWHAREYGLFAVNPFARHAYDPSAAERTTTLDKDKSLHLRFRLAVYSGKTPKPRLDQDFAAFSAQPFK